MFGVGDRVVVRDGVFPGHVYGGVFFVEKMDEMREQTLTISDVECDDGHYFYKVLEDRRWNWTEDMLVGIDSDGQIDEEPTEDIDTDAFYCIIGA